MNTTRFTGHPDLTIHHYSNWRNEVRVSFRFSDGRLGTWIIRDARSLLAGKLDSPYAEVEGCPSLRLPVPVAIIAQAVSIAVRACCSDLATRAGESLLDIADD